MSKDNWYANYDEIIIKIKNLNNKHSKQWCPSGISSK